MDIYLILGLLGIVSAVYGFFAYRIRGGMTIFGIGTPRGVDLVINSLPLAVMTLFALGINLWTLGAVGAALLISTAMFSMGHGNAMRMGRLDAMLTNGGYSPQREVPWDWILGEADHTKSFNMRRLRDGAFMALSGMMHTLPFAVSLAFFGLWIPAGLMLAGGLFKVVAYEVGWQVSPVNRIGSEYKGPTELAEGLTGMFMQVFGMLALSFALLYN